jgi:hypothetical protein
LLATAGQLGVLGYPGLISEGFASIALCSFFDG